MFQYSEFNIVSDKIRMSVYCAGRKTQKISDVWFFDV